MSIAMIWCEKIKTLTFSSSLQIPPRFHSAILRFNAKLHKFYASHNYKYTHIAYWMQDGKMKNAVKINLAPGGGRQRFPETGTFFRRIGDFAESLRAPCAPESTADAYLKMGKLHLEAYMRNGNGWHRQKFEAAIRMALEIYETKEKRVGLSAQELLGKAECLLLLHPMLPGSKIECIKKAYEACMDAVKMCGTDAEREEIALEVLKLLVEYGEDTHPGFGKIELANFEGGLTPQSNVRVNMRIAEYLLLTDPAHHLASENLGKAHQAYGKALNLCGEAERDQIRQTAFEHLLQYADKCQERNYSIAGRAYGFAADFVPESDVGMQLKIAECLLFDQGYSTTLGNVRKANRIYKKALGMCEEAERSQIRQTAFEHLLQYAYQC
ncbi:MAG: hypothetical protein PHS02_04710, partial [Candidatus ainarchaeum sp.]|nr:hypothetical protein [Candidatus ainarchaeum sp.]